VVAADEHEGESHNGERPHGPFEAFRLGKLSHVIHRVTSISILPNLAMD
jgi:hypothetical protein